MKTGEYFNVKPYFVLVYVFQSAGTAELEADLVGIITEDGVAVQVKLVQEIVKSSPQEQVLQPSAAEKVSPFG